MQNLEGWVTVEDYAASRGISVSVVHKRVFDGVWIRGVHYSVPYEKSPGYVNLAAAEAWETAKSSESVTGGT